MPEDRLLTLAEIADLTRLPLSTLRYYRQRGEGPPTFKLGRRVVGWERDVWTWMRARTELSRSGDQASGAAVPAQLPGRRSR